MAAVASINVHLMIEQTPGQPRRVGTWECVPAGIPELGDTVVINDRTRRVEQRRWRGPHLLQLFLGEPLAAGYPYQFIPDDATGVTHD